MKELLLKLYEYNGWANARILEVAAQVPAEQLTAASEINHGSLLGLLFHAMATESNWRSVLQEGCAPLDPPRKNDYANLESIHEAWSGEADAMRAHIDTLSETELVTPVQVTDWRGRQRTVIPWQVLTHLALHGMQHRSEAAAALTALGHSPGDLDFIFFV